MISINDWLKKNSVPLQAIKSGKYIVAISSSNKEKSDAIIKSNDGQVIKIDKVESLDLEVDDSKKRIFVIKADSWKRMTEKNLWVANQNLTNKGKK